MVVEAWGIERLDGNIETWDEEGWDVAGDVEIADVNAWCCFRFCAFKSALR